MIQDLTLPHHWQTEILVVPPLIAPARQYTYPLQIAGEEDALARGALQLLVTPAAGPNFLATCALGFTDPSMPTGLLACPNPDELCALAGGYAYIIRTDDPTRSTHLPLKPVTEARVLRERNLLLFAGFHTLLALGADDIAWHTARLTWEGLRITGIDATHIHGLGWDMRTDKELPFAVDLRTGTHTGGGFNP